MMGGTKVAVKLQSGVPTTADRSKVCARVYCLLQPMALTGLNVGRELMRSAGIPPIDKKIQREEGVALERWQHWKLRKLAVPSGLCAHD